MTLSMLLIILGALIMAYSMVKYYRLLVYMNGQIYEKNTFHHWIYGASFAMMAFFLVGYICVFTMQLTGSYNNNNNDFMLISVIFFFGAIFVLCMVNVQQKMTGAIATKSLENIRSLIGSIEAKDKYTKGHSDHVYMLVELVYNHLPPELKSKINLTKLKDAAILHDIGKIGIPDSVLNKPDKLNEEEYNIIKQHPQNGKIILENTSFREICDWVLYHHERVDGKGYYGISGDDIPIEAKIIAIADTFSALYTDRSYRKKLPFDKSISIIKEAAGTQLDSVLVDIFCGIDREEIEKVSING
jgi:HD-GYP domain-containing protein (c-di-GMP phosphodiesterase class II)